VTLKSQVNRVFHTSMEVGVEVYQTMCCGERKHTTTAYVTFVAIDEHTRKPKLVPPLILKTAAERKRYRERQNAEDEASVAYGKDRFSVVSFQLSVFSKSRIKKPSMPRCCQARAQQCCAPTSDQ